MTCYEYECGKCKRRQDDFYEMGFAPPAVECAGCGGRAYRVFSVGAIKTDRNNPLRKLGRMIGGDTSTRAAAARTFSERGLVMANGRECDDAERGARGEQRRLDKVVRDTVREYNQLPARMRAADAAKVAKEESARLKVAASALA